MLEIDNIDLTHPKDLAIFTDFGYQLVKVTCFYRFILVRFLSIDYCTCWGFSLVFESLNKRASTARTGSPLVGLPGDTKRPLKQQRVLPGAFFIVLSYFTAKIYRGKFSRGIIGYTGKCHFPLGNLVFT